MRLDVTSNGTTRRDIPLEEISSIVSIAEYRKLQKLKVGEAFERNDPHNDFSFKATRTG